MRHRAMGRRDGLTLVEVVVATFVFGIFIGGACALVLSSGQLSDRARDHYVAVNIAKNRIEKARTAEFEQLSLFEEGNVVVDVNGSPDPEGQYRRTTQLSTVTTNLMEVVVTVEIRDRVTWNFGVSQEELRTYVAKYVEAPE